MKYFKTRLLVMCGSLIVAAAVLAPVVANAQCPIWVQDCGNMHLCGCPGTPQGTDCVYDLSCLNKGCCHKDDDLLFE